LEDEPRATRRQWVGFAVFLIVVFLGLAVFVAWLFDALTNSCCLSEAVAVSVIG
jgi:hypothetical protein